MVTRTPVQFTVPGQALEAPVSSGSGVHAHTRIQAKTNVSINMSHESRPRNKPGLRRTSLSTSTY
jgi:hypothetical protein